MPVTVAGLDVGFSNDYMALAVIQKSSVDEKQVIKLVHLFTWNNFDWTSWKRDMESKYFQFGISKVYADQTNNQSVVSELNSHGIRTNGITFTNPSKQDMLQQLRKVLSTGELVFPVPEKIQSQLQQKYFEELVTEMTEQEVIHDSANPKFAHPSGHHDDLLWALCLAVYGSANENEFYGKILKDN